MAAQESTASDRSPGSAERLSGALALAALLALVATGLWVFFAPAGPSSFATLLAHVGIGAVSAPLLLAYLALHVGRLWARDRGGSRAVALIAVAILGGALASGGGLAILYAAGNAPAAATHFIHAVLGGLVVVLVPVHLRTTQSRLGLSKLAPLGLVVGVAVAGSGLAVGLMAAWLAMPEAHRPVPADYPRSPDGSLFGASLMETPHDGFLALRSLTGSAECGACHAEILQEWSASVHRFSGIDNPLIATATRPAEEGGGVAAARYCAACHEPVALATGALVGSTFDVPPAHRGVGVTCLVCHGIQRVPGLEGNGQMVLDPPQLFPLFNTGSAVAAAAHRVLVASYPDAHRRAMRPPIMSNSQQCSSCHTVNAHAGLNGFGFVRLHNENDDWGVSAFAHGVGPEDRVVRCQDCHMGRVAGSRDPVAGRRGGAHRSHRFLGANTFVAEHFGDAAQRRGTDAFLRGEAFPEEIRGLLPEGPPVAISVEAPAEAGPGQRVPVAVVLTNRSVGHAFPAGPNEVHEAWVELVARDSEGRVLFVSGALDESGVRDPEAFALVSVPVDAAGEEIPVTAGLSAGFRHRRSILHGQSDRNTYELRLPADPAGGVVRLSARLRYRKADADFARLMQGFTLDDVPITDIAEAEAEIRVRGGS